MCEVQIKKGDNKLREQMLKRHAVKKEQGNKKHVKSMLELRIESLPMNTLVTLFLRVFGTCSQGTVLDVHLHRCIFTDALWF